MDKVLVVDDEAAITEMVADWLTQAGYQALTAAGGQEALREFFHHQPDLVILDILMPQMDGYEVCQRIREVADVPLIILSAKEEERDKVKALELGADDYLTKPVGQRELLARVQAALRRARMPPVGYQETMYADAELSIDYARREVRVRGQKLTLTPIEYRLLACLVQHSGQVLSQEQLLDRVWGSEFYSAGSVKWHIGHLRQKIEVDPQQPRLIVTVRSVGYRYEKPRPGP